MFVLTYIILTVTFGYVLIVTETSLGRMTRKSPVGAFKTFGDRLPFKLGGWINAVIPMLIVPYYSVIGGWVLKYLCEYIIGDRTKVSMDGYFGSFISASGQVELWFLVFAALNFIVILMGVQSGIERISKIMMPILVILAVIIAVFSVTRPGAAAGVRYLFVPDLKNFSIMTVVTAMGQNFYSLSIAMGILYTYGSYMKKDVNIERSTWEVEIFDTGIALLAAMMIIPAVFAFSGGDQSALNAGPSLMFITLPKVFASMGTAGTVVGILFFILVLFAALTSSISLMETSVSTFTDELHIDRKKASAIMVIFMLVIGTLSSSGYGVLANVTIFGMQFLDFFDFLTNSIMMPIAAFATCLLVVLVVTTKKIEEEVEVSSKFRWKKLYNICIRYIAPIIIIIILVSSIMNVIGIIHM